MSEVKEMEDYIKSLQEDIERKQKVDRLFCNQDFIDIIKNGFCRDEMMRYQTLSVSEKVKSEERELFQKLAGASGVLINYLDFITQRGVLAEEDIEGAKDNLEMLRASKESDNE